MQYQIFFYHVCLISKCNVKELISLPPEIRAIKRAKLCSKRDVYNRFINNIAIILICK